MNRYWEIDQGRVDSVRFFPALWRHFPEATTLYAEGTSIADDVRLLYEQEREEGEYLPPRHTLWPRSAKYRCRFSDRLVTALSELAENHAEPELLDHLMLYRGAEELVLWPDAFDHSLLVSRAVPEETVAQFAADLETGYSGASR